MKLRIVLITNIPAPYRIPVYNKIAEKVGGDFTVFYCARKEPNRGWDINLTNLIHNYIFLKEKMFNYKGRFIHINLDVWKKLKKHNPDIVVSTSFNPTMLLAWFYTIIYRKKHIIMSDGWFKSENSLSKLHFFIRRIVYKFSDAFIGASKHTLSMFEQYSIPKEKVFQSCLCIDNEKFKKFTDGKKKYDVMFSGQFVERKMPFFFLEVIKKLKKYKKDLKILLIGSGPLKGRILEELSKNKINYKYPGFVEQEDLPKYYAGSKLLLFPTKSDPWGIVANEACAAGTPVITCNNAGVANDLIYNGINGFVLPLDVDLWVDRILKLLSDKKLYNKMSTLAVRKVQEYNFNVAAEGFIKACEKVID